jgi:hypothetical protein
MARSAYGALRLWGAPLMSERSDAPHKAPRSGRRPMSEHSDAAHQRSAPPYSPIVSR